MSVNGLSIRIQNNLIKRYTVLIDKIFKKILLKYAKIGNDEYDF